MFHTRGANTQRRKKEKSGGVKNEGSKVDEDIRECLKTMCHGFAIKDSKRLFPLREHKKVECIFDMKKLTSYAEQNLEDARGRNDFKLHLQKEVDERYTRDYALNLGGNVALAPVLKPAAEFELSLVRNSEKSQSFQGEMIEKRFQMGKKALQLPSHPPPDSKARDASSVPKTLSDILTGEVSESIECIHNDGEAEAFMDRYGYIYVENATMGGSLIEASMTTQLLQTNRTRTKIGASVQGQDVAQLPVVGGKVGGLAAFGTDFVQRMLSSVCYTHLIGGGEDVDDVASWKKTIGNNREIIKCDFQPIYELAQPESRQYVLLKRAYDKHFQIISDGEYNICNLDKKQDSPSYFFSTDPNDFPFRWFGGVAISAEPEAVTIRNVEAGDVTFSVKKENELIFFSRRMIPKARKTAATKWRGGRFCKDRKKWHLERVEKETSCRIREGVGGRALGIDPGHNYYEIDSCARDSMEERFKWTFEKVDDSEEKPNGKRLKDEKPEKLNGEKPNGEGETPETPNGEKPKGEKPNDEKPKVEKPETPKGEKPETPKNPRREKPETPRGEKPEKPKREKPNGEKPMSEKPNPAILWALTLLVTENCAEWAVHTLVQK